MKRLCSTFLAASLFFAITTAVVAQTPTTANSASPRPLRPRIEASPLPPKPPIGREIRPDIRDLRQDGKEKRQVIREETRENIQNLREKRQEALEKVREEAKARFKTQREAFLEKKEAIKDIRKKAVVERVDQKMADINKRRTDQMNETLTRLTELLNKLQTRVDKAKENGKDTAGTVEPIAKGREAIVAAQTAVTAQAGKEYIANVSEETRLKADVGSAVKNLEKDLKATHQTVLAAKKAVSDALKSVKTIKGVDDGGTSPSPTAISE